MMTTDNKPSPEAMCAAELITAQWAMIAYCGSTEGSKNWIATIIDNAFANRFSRTDEHLGELNEDICTLIDKVRDEHEKLVIMTAERDHYRDQRSDESWDKLEAERDMLKREYERDCGGSHVRRLCELNTQLCDERDTLKADLVVAEAKLQAIGQDRMPGLRAAFETAQRKNERLKADLDAARADCAAMRETLKNHWF